MLQDADEGNVGFISGQALLNVLTKVVKKLTSEELERFVRFLDKDKLGRINYMDDVWQHPALKTKEVESRGARATFVRRVCDPGTEVRVVPRLGEHTAAVRAEFGD
jgi:crotonobetainyl-CoA:carnitine CoA-transferase CaiB-like acyl-CoA transferase